MTSPEEFDVVVVGSGPGGLMATIRAAKLGKKVALIETENQLGGTGRGSAYGMWIPQNRLIKALGIKEDKALCLKWMCKHAYPDVFDENIPFFGIPKKDYALFSQYFDSAGEMLDFLLEETDNELVFMRNHADDFDTYEQNRDLLKKKYLPENYELVRALPDYHPEDAFNEVPLGRYVNLKSNLFSIMQFFISMFRNMEFRLLLSGLFEMIQPKVLWQIAKGFFGKNDEGAFYYCGSGLRVTRSFKRVLDRYKVPVFLEHKLERVLFDESGAVKAVCIESKGKK